MSGSRHQQVGKNGFTLLEMVVSIGVFSALVIIAIGITLSVSQAQIKASNLQAIMDSIRFSSELMTKEIRTGSGYQASSYGAACGATSNSEISFTTALGEQRVYYLNASTKRIMRIIGSTDCTRALEFSAEDVFIDRLNFILAGQTAGPNDGQPRVTIILKARSTSPQFQLESSMNLQTTVVQRLRDL